MRSDLWDTEWVGFLLGVVGTILGFLGYGLIYTTAIRPHTDMNYYVFDLFLGTHEYHSKILSLSLIGVIPLFFLFNYLDKPKLMKGMLISMFVSAILIVVLWF